MRAASGGHRQGGFRLGQVPHLHVPLLAGRAGGHARRGAREHAQGELNPDLNPAPTLPQPYLNPASTLKPRTLNPKPQTLNHESNTLNPKTLDPKPETLNP